MRRQKREFFRIKKFTKRYNKRNSTFTFDITYETTVALTPRTKAVAEAFGLGIDETQKFPLYDNIKLKVGLKDIVYITGDSGSGKSVLLKAIRKSLGDDAVDMADICVEENKPIIETVGKTFSEALELLSKVGLNDAFLFVRSYSELSEGQKYRYRLAKLIESGRQWWICDEFCSMLDRDTARVVAFNFQKLARSNGKGVVVATAHSDLFEDLKPNVNVHKGFGKEITVAYYPNNLALECSLVREMHIDEGSLADYRRLSCFHYRSCRCPPPRRVFVLKREGEVCGVIVYCFPSPVVFGRSRVWKGSFSQLQAEVSTIARVVVHPKYRSVGLGVKLVRDTLGRVGTPCVEALAVMAKYNPFFEKAGMRKVAESKPSVNVLRAIKRLGVLGFDFLLLESVKENLRVIERVGKAKVLEVLEELSKREGVLRRRLLALSSVYPGHDEFLEKLHGLGDEGLAVVLKRLAFLAQSKVYLFWRKCG